MHEKKCLQFLSGFGKNLHVGKKTAQLIGSMTFSVRDASQLRFDFRQFGHAPKKELELDARGFNDNALQGKGAPVAGLQYARGYFTAL